MENQSTHSYFLSVEAEKELLEAVTFYEAQASRSIANAFLSEFDRVALLVTQNPELGKHVANGYRLFPLHRFPYSLVYRAIDEYVRIAAVAHHSRRPGYWRARQRAQ